MSDLWVEDIEYHQVNTTKTWYLDEDDVIETFGSVEEFQRLFDEGDEKAILYVYEGDYERNDNWWTDDIGGYDVDTSTSWEKE